MQKRLITVIAAVVMFSVLLAPVFAWTYPDCTEDQKFEKFGPRADQLLISMYAGEVLEWETGLEGGEIDVTDWPLDSAHKTRYDADPRFKVLGYGADFGLYLFDLNQNNNSKLGNDADGWTSDPNPVYPNPMGYDVTEGGLAHDNGWWLRHAIAHLVDRNAIVDYVGTAVATAVYHIMIPAQGKYLHPDLVPGGALEDMLHLYNPAEANAILDASGYFPYGGDGWRYWDRNKNNIKEVGEDLKLKLFGRSDHDARKKAAELLDAELTGSVKIHTDLVLGDILAARLQCMDNKDFHIHTGGWSLNVDPDHLVLWHWDYYWHPGRPYNYAATNKDTYNDAAYGVQYANTQPDAVINARICQYVWCDSVLGVCLYSAAGYKVMSKTYVGPEEQHGEEWYGVVNWPGYGIDNIWTFQNMHASGHALGGAIRYGLKTTTVGQLNPVYSEWTWDNMMLDIIGYGSLTGRDPYTLERFGWVAETYKIGTYMHPTYGTCTKAVFTLRPDVYFDDGTQLTIADVVFTFMEIDDILAARGLLPPWWFGNVMNILSFSVLDPFTFEVLLDVKSIYAVGWIGGNRILPKHIWKPICEGATAPKSGLPWDPTTFAPDPDLIGAGTWRLDEYIPGDRIVLQANKPGLAVDTGISSDPNKNSEPIYNAKGFHQRSPVHVSTHAGDYMAKLMLAHAAGQVPPTNVYSASIAVEIRSLWLNHCYGGMLLVDKYVYVDGALLAGFPVDVPIYTLSDGTIVPEIESFNLDLSKCMHEVKVAVQIRGPLILNEGGSGEPNPWIDQWINVTAGFWVTIAEDVTGGYYVNAQLAAPDCKVDLQDVYAAGKAFGSTPGHPEWNSGVGDINHDYKIDLKDYYAISKMFGKW